MQRSAAARGLPARPGGIAEYCGDAGERLPGAFFFLKISPPNAFFFLIFPPICDVPSWAGLLSPVPGVFGVVVAGWRQGEDDPRVPRVPRVPFLP